MQHWERWLLLALLLALPACRLRGTTRGTRSGDSDVTVAAVTREAQAAPPVDTADWLDASVPGMTFRGSLLYFCRGISVTQARSAAPEVREAVVAWPERHLLRGCWRWASALAAPSQTLADLETLANAGLKADLCSSYADFWPDGALTPSPRLTSRRWRACVGSGRCALRWCRTDTCRTGAGEETVDDFFDKRANGYKED